ncbi:U32 family peptidase [Bacteriovorax stolpii]|uniref:Peptidase U32 n=1 Tax=Bacteriovorax stolpii TaxID=960 RepID=A0A2K9NRL3_BACTC|nr:U32 family peptidase [Bacteriovorax stolpii]AUN98147.1 peptidase U32 [Bacteriovorax stolpii]QDK41873.1 U32 family peptidase [Bacteriovorax stolpii]TDP52061.1 putative protease [Bacteriovorax stolpii]BDT28244.1 U32 family peptidase [Bacteriovorax sp. HI3]
MTNTIWTPELLSPAGSLEKLKVAVLYGADAVYLGGQKFGLRQASDNFTAEELKEGVEFAHERGSLVYVVLNSFLHDKDLEELPEFLALLSELKVDAVIVSDLGVITEIQKHSNLVIHLSTQASCLNVESAKLWKKMGVTRIVLGREVTIKEAKKIKEETGLEIEMFVHGSMCMAFSGNCVISNYTQGRDSNRGGCAHSCRFEYSIDFNQDEEAKKAFFMSSKDLEGIRMLTEFIEAGIDSLKVEGRNKSHYYAGTVSKVYAEALRYYKTHGNFLSDDLIRWEEELRKISHRDYTTGSLDEYADESSIYNQRESDEIEYTVSGVVLEVKENEHILMEVRSAFYPGDELEIMPFKGRIINHKIATIKTIAGIEIPKSKPGSVVKVPYMAGAERFNLIRKKAEVRV